MNSVFQGFLLGMAYVAPIGMQNLNVINSALTMDRWRALSVAWITVLFDISLAVFCFLGVGTAVGKNELIRAAFLLVGSVMVISIGAGIMRSTPKLETTDTPKSLKALVITCFVVTWMNPQALIDGSLLLGGTKATLTVAQGNLFILGVCAASLIWFTALSLITNKFHHFFNQKSMKVVNLVCGAVVVFFGIRLFITFTTLAPAVIKTLAG
jgi:L-lysine exporter family protein LysE/ArgO